MIRNSIVYLLIALALICGGCASRHQPAPASTLDAREAQVVLAMRESAVKTVSGNGDVMLTRPNGQSVTLATAMVISLPDRVRLRAWKMGQAVLDLTITPDGVWVLVADKNRREEILPAGKSAANLMESLASIQGGFFSSADLSLVEETPTTFRFERQIEKQRLRCEVDRATLFVQRFEVYDETGIRRFTLEYSQHRRIGGTIWPMRTKAISEQGTIDVMLDAVELNTPPAAGAFVPPRRAEKIQ